MNDSRHHDRITVDRPIAIRLSSGQLVRARLVSLSAGGIGVYYPAPAEVGSVLSMRFQLPDSRNETVTIHCQGVVRFVYLYRDGYMSGFEFSQISEDDRAVIRQFIRRKRTKA